MKEKESVSNSMHEIYQLCKISNRLERIADILENPKESLNKQKVKGVIDKLILENNDDCYQCEGIEGSQSGEVLTELKKELGVEDKCQQKYYYGFYLFQEQQLVLEIYLINLIGTKSLLLLILQRLL